MRQYYYSLEDDCVYARPQLSNKGSLDKVIYLGWFKSAREAYSYAFWSGITRKDG